jgi:hypothetical protein
LADFTDVVVPAANGNPPATKAPVPVPTPPPKPEPPKPVAIDPTLKDLSRDLKEAVAKRKTEPVATPNFNLVIPPEGELP